jgi:uncharacterized protein (DUF1501 family)
VRPCVRASVRPCVRASVRPRLCLAVLGEGLTTHTTRQLAVEDYVVILQVLILLLARIKTNLGKAIASHTALPIGHGSPRSTTNLGGGTGHTTEMTTFACKRPNSRNPAGTT